MDCFYAAVEIRDNPSLKNKPVAIGASPDKRGVICTCNYIARQYGIHSAMSTTRAYKLCKNLILLPVNMPKYRLVSNHVHDIFHEFTHLIEPLSLDEAYLDVTDSTHCQGSATLIAKAIRRRIWEETKLTASAGVAPNKFLAKIASSWNKPNGLFVIRPHEIDSFVKNLTVDKLYGVGKITAEKLCRLGLKTCADLQKWPLSELISKFGKLGQHLYEQCRGQDSRQVEPNRARKSISVETTFSEDIHSMDTCLDKINELYNRLLMRIQESAPDRLIKSQYIKIKFNDFKLTTSAIISNEINLEFYLELFRKTFSRSKKPIRLIGLGIHLHADTEREFTLQQPLFIDSSSIKSTEIASLFE